MWLRSKTSKELSPLNPGMLVAFGYHIVLKEVDTVQQIICTVAISTAVIGSQISVYCKYWILYSSSLAKNQYRLPRNISAIMLKHYAIGNSAFAPEFWPTSWHLHCSGFFNSSCCEDYVVIISECFVRPWRARPRVVCEIRNVAASAA